MRRLHLTASIETFEKSGRLTLPAGGTRAFYVIDGAVRLEGERISASLSANSAAFAAESVDLVSREGGRVVRWDLHGSAAPTEASRREAVEARTLLTAPLDIAPDVVHLLRCDRVEFPPGGVAYLHTHRGPGIRVLLFGDIRIDAGGQSHSYAPLEAWFESGPEPVFAAASQSEPTAFVRVMILPAELRGTSSIRYERDEDRDKPKPQRYQVYIDHVL